MKDLEESERRLMEEGEEEDFASWLEDDYNNFWK